MLEERREMDTLSGVFDEHGLEEVSQMRGDDSLLSGERESKGCKYCITGPQ
jgi:hypothetical protein